MVGLELQASPYMQTNHLKMKENAANQEADAVKTAVP